MIPEKIRAAFQRNNSRDIFDLNQYGQLAFNEELVRTMAVLKCWQDRGMYAGPKNFDGEELLSKLQVDKYSWERLKPQVSPHAWIDPSILLQKIKTRYAFLRQLTKLELELCLDRGKKKNLLHDELWKNCQRLHNRRDFYMNAAGNDELTRDQIIDLATRIAKERYGMTLRQFISAVKNKQLDDICDVMEIIIGLLSLLSEYESELAAA